MSKIYFFKNDKECKWMLNEIKNNYPKYLHNSISYDEIDKKHKKKIKPYIGKKKFYAILDWVQKKKDKSLNSEVLKGVNPKWVNEIGGNVVQSFKDLPENAGIYITGYDSNLIEIEKAKKKNITIIDNACPWVRRIKDQILDVNTNTHQCAILIDKDHVVYECYKSILPKNTIILSVENYKDEIDNNFIGKPIYLIVYSVFRKKESERIKKYILKKCPGKKHILDGYKKTLCCWTNQGILEEIEESIKIEKLDEIWVICSSENDRSTKSILNEIIENGVEPVILKKEKDIPVKINNKKIGVLLAPVPVSSEIKNIINKIKIQYNIKT